MINQRDISTVPFSPPSQNNVYTRGMKKTKQNQTQSENNCNLDFNSTQTNHVVAGFFFTIFFLGGGGRRWSEKGMQ